MICLVSLITFRASLNYALLALILAYCGIMYRTFPYNCVLIISDNIICLYNFLPLDFPLFLRFSFKV